MSAINLLEQLTDLAKPKKVIARPMAKNTIFWVKLDHKFFTTDWPTPYEVVLFSPRFHPRARKNDHNFFQGKAREVSLESKDSPKCLL